ncbi:MAG: DUF3122 domain-containing protein [Microcystis aeruginosa G13-05]|nr:DUF3122 domain-containing protein [Microcystis aeruginosa BS11-05]NCS51299.1 DUF3122 domain-containing protein [Microcystis aeruginosa G13-05]
MLKLPRPSSGAAHSPIPFKQYVSITIWRYNCISLAKGTKLLSYFICYVNKVMKRFLLLFCVLVSFLLFISFEIDFSLSALALTRQQLEGPGQLLYQSRHSLRDDTGSTWQVVLFKRIKDGETLEISLRLVGFPEGIEFLHGERLTITTAKGEILAAKDAFAEKSPAANVGQYEMQDILPQLPVTEAIELSLPLEAPRHLNIPIPVLLEWQSLLFSPNVRLFGLG